MRLSEQEVIRHKTSAIMLDWAKDREPPFTGETSEGFGDAITAAHLIADEARISLHRWVDAARRAGLSWTDIGGALGISKQAAQQRFKPEEIVETPVSDDEEVVRLGAHAFNELQMLQEEGAKGNELIRVGFLSLIFRGSSQAWEYRRMIGAPRSDIGDGWQYVAAWMPFTYYKRAITDA